MNNVLSKSLALKVVAQGGMKEQGKDLIPKIVESLMMTERNFILKSGESTVGIEKDKIEERMHEKLLETLRSLGPDMVKGKVQSEVK